MPCLEQYRADLEEPRENCQADRTHPSLAAAISRNWHHSASSGALISQRDISVIAVMESSSVRVTPPNSISHQREWP